MQPNQTRAGDQGASKRYTVLRIGRNDRHGSPGERQ
jgi:hypothetical protein